MNNVLLTEMLGVYIIDMECCVHEQVVKNADSSYTILINARLTCEQQMCAYQHAIRHIMNMDFEKDSADKAECRVRASV